MRPHAPSQPWRWAALFRVLILSSADLLALLASGALAVLLWAYPVHGQTLGLYLPAAPLAILVVLAYGQGRLYPGFGLGPVEMLRRYWLITIGAFVFMASLVLGLKLENVYSRVTLALALILSLLLVPAVRWSLLRVMRRFTWWPEPVVVITDEAAADRTARLLSRWPKGDLAPIDVVEIDPTSPALRRGADAFEEAEAVTRHAEAGVQIALLDIRGPRAALAMDWLGLLFPRVIVLREFQELPIEGVQVQNLGRMLGLEYSSNLLRRQSRWVKRLADVVVASVALLLAMPVLVLAIIAVKLTSPGPALFLHRREGRDGRSILVPKIRTMVPRAEEEMERLFREEPGLQEQWRKAYKLRNDPRLIPKVGALLRRWSIDELPQLWSVIRGDMSLVGPRPLPTYHLDALSPQTRHLRRQVRPGLTGLWQINARGEPDLDAQEAHDIYYIRNWSIWLDLYILAQTVYPVISGRGAH